MGRPSLLTRAGYHPAPPGPVVASLEAETLDALAALLHELAERWRARDIPVALPVAHDDGWLSLTDAARLTRLGKGTLVRLIQAGTLPALRDADGAAHVPYRLRRTDIDALAEAPQ